ncbi:hypothetical protein EVAR_17261_1 [Eumeta japonica]|uniref:Uncharacterized protein n=1 Tax=Eumeta variegata TaxID=151549 RepID=A0A4C1TT04_EUMVA|nr:hypothetical protein EVAR_17261_1 [Eumeta japonica]
MPRPALKNGRSKDKLRSKSALRDGPFWAGGKETAPRLRPTCAARRSPVSLLPPGKITRFRIRMVVRVSEVVSDRGGANGAQRLGTIDPAGKVAPRRPPPRPPPVPRTPLICSSSSTERLYLPRSAFADAASYEET